MRYAPELMLATRNPGKVSELRELLAAHMDLSEIVLRTPRDWPAALPDVAETGATFAENARLKAAALASATGLPALADDSGLCVDVIGGRPGLYSARWAGPEATDADRCQKLMDELRGVPTALRTAQFVCAVALALPGGAFYESSGICRGLILEEPRGSGGFGYDPLFLLERHKCTMAELPPPEKNQWSHRADALRGLRNALQSVFGSFQNEFDTP